MTISMEDPSTEIKMAVVPTNINLLMSSSSSNNNTIMSRERLRCNNNSDSNKMWGKGYMKPRALLIKKGTKTLTMWPKLHRDLRDQSQGRIYSWQAWKCIRIKMQQTVLLIKLYCATRKPSSSHLRWYQSIDSLSLRISSCQKKSFRSLKSMEEHLISLQENGSLVLTNTKRWQQKFQDFVVWNW